MCGVLFSWKEGSGGLSMPPGRWGCQLWLRCQLVLLCRWAVGCGEVKRAGLERWWINFSWSLNCEWMNELAVLWNSNGLALNEIYQEDRIQQQIHRSLAACCTDDISVVSHYTGLFLFQEPYIAPCHFLFKASVPLFHLRNLNASTIIMW